MISHAGAQRQAHQTAGVRFLNSANELAILGRDIFFSLRNSMDLCEVAASLEAGGNATK